MKEKLTEKVIDPHGDGEEKDDAYIRSHPTMGRKNAVGSHDSLCWYCKRAYGSCSWSSNFIPVAGWDAKPSKYSSYRVYGCPKFIRG